jgi:hypothetical protein
VSTPVDVAVYTSLGSVIVDAVFTIPAVTFSCFKPSGTKKAFGLSSAHFFASRFRFGIAAIRWNE